MIPSDKMVMDEAKRRFPVEAEGGQSLAHYVAEREKIAVQEFLKLARRIKKRDSWFIGGFLGEVEEEWEQNH